MAPPSDLRAWIALLEREGELVRVSAEVDPDLEITEIVDRTVKAGGPALLFEHPKGSEHPLLINQFGTERRMCLAFDARSLDEVATRLQSVHRDAAAAGPGREGARPGEAEVDRRLDAEVGAFGPGAGGRPPGRRGEPRPAADPALLARRPGALRHAPGRDHEGPAQRHAQRRHVPDAEDRPAFDLHALAGAQGRAHGLHGRRRAARRRRRARARPGDGLLGERAAAEAHRRVHARGVPARRAGRARPGEDRRPGGAGERRDRARGLRRGG